MNDYLLSLLKPHTRIEQEILSGDRSIDPEIFTDITGSVVTKNRIDRMGRQIMLSQHYRFTEIPKHKHDYIEVCYVCSGSLTHIVNEKHELVVKAGELLMLNRHAEHAIKLCTEDDIAVNFLVLPSFFDTTMSLVSKDSLLGRFLISAVREKNADISFLYFQVADKPVVQNLVENLIYSLTDDVAGSVREEKLTMALLFLQLMKYSERLTVQTASNSEGMVIEVLREIEDNWVSASLEAVAKRNHVSSAYISRLVKESTGSTFKELLMEKRFFAAKELLRSTAMPVQQIASCVGYDNTSFFFRKFAERTGQTPGEYRSGKNKIG